MCDNQQRKCDKCGKNCRKRCPDKCSKRCHDKCYRFDQLERKYRKTEALQKSSEILFKIILASDNAFYTTGEGDPFFETNFEYIVCQLADPNQTNLRFDQRTITNSSQLKSFYNEVARNLLYYRKRWITDIIVTEYEDLNCRRKITFHYNGFSLQILGNKSSNVPPGIPPGPYENNILITDRNFISFEEVSKGVFKVTSLVQVTEARFPLPNRSEIPSPPTNSNGQLIPSDPSCSQYVKCRYFYDD